MLALATAQQMATGAPMFTDVDTLRTRARTVVIGTARSTTGPDGGVALSVDVDTVVRGAVKPGPMPVLQSPDGSSFPDGDRVVGFIDDGALRWVGRLAAGPSLERGVIQLHGFFDWNMHIVAPGIVTLAQLPRLLDTGTLTHTFVVTLAFTDGKGGMARSAKRFTVEWTMPPPGARTQPAPKVTGLTARCLGAPYLRPLEWGGFGLSLHEDCPSRSDQRRALELTGKYVGVDPTTGAIEVEAFPARPFLTEREYESFTADATIVDVQRVVRVKAADGSSYEWRLGEGFVDAKGRALKAGTMGTRGHMSGGQQRYSVDYQFGDLTVTLTSSTGYGVSTGGSPSGIIAMMFAPEPYTCELSRAGAAPIQCKLHVEKPRVVRRKR